MLSLARRSEKPDTFTGWLGLLLNEARERMHEETFQFKAVDEH